MIQSTPPPHTCAKERITLKVAGLEDSNYVLQLANDSLVRKAAFTQRHISEEEHKLWFEAMLSTDKPFFIAYYDNSPCGYVRFSESLQVADIAIAISSEFRNKGLGAEMIKCACSKVLSTTEIIKILAHIKIKNTASIKAFTKAHFVELEKSIENQTITLEYPAYDEFYFK